MCSLFVLAVDEHGVESLALRREGVQRVVEEIVLLQGVFRDGAQVGRALDGRQVGCTPRGEDVAPGHSRVRSELEHVVEREVVHQAPE